MTPRENLLEVLRCGSPRWMPACIHLISINNVPGHLPAELLAEPLDALAISRYVGGDVLYEVSAVGAENAPGVESRTERDGDVSRTVVETPAGALTQESISTEVPTPDYGTLPPGHALPGPLVTHTRRSFFVKSAGDYPRLRAMVEGTTYRADADRLQRELDRLGEDGVMVLGGGPGSPLYRLAESMAGIERFSYDLVDHPQEVERSMEALHEQACRWYRAAAAAPGDAVRCTEDLDTKLVSPAMFREYAASRLADYARICHEAGKLFVIHMCGHIHDFLEAVRDLPADAIHCVTPPPTGNTTPAEAVRLLNGKTAAMLRFDATTLLNGTFEQIDRAVEQLVEQTAGCGNVLVIMPCGRAPLKNVRRVIERVHELGGKGDYA